MTRRIFGACVIGHLVDHAAFPYVDSAAPTRVEVVSSVQRRRRWTPEQKSEIVKEPKEPSSSVAMVVRQFCITAAQFFQWRKAYLQGLLMAVGANETVVPASELQEVMRQIKQLEAALGSKALENEILKEAVDFAKAKKLIARSPVLPAGRAVSGHAFGVCSHVLTMRDRSSEWSDFSKSALLVVDPLTP